MDKKQKDKMPRRVYAPARNTTNTDCEEDITPLMASLVHKPLIVIEWVLYISVISRHWYLHFLLVYAFTLGQSGAFLIHVFISNKTQIGQADNQSTPRTDEK